jgi:hypothetical protein
MVSLYYNKGRKTGAVSTGKKVLFDFFIFLVRSAYLRLSKDFHPDLNVGKDEQDTETIHNKGRS